MKNTCACCGIELVIPLRDCSREDGSLICLSCESRERMKVPVNLRSFLDDLNAPVVLVDESGVVQIANIHTSRLLHKHLAGIEGNVGGDVFECAYSKLPEKCGNTVHCTGCSIRNCVMDTHATGKPMLKIPATLKQLTAGEPQEVHWYISTEKLDKYVILTIHCPI